jgi:hypothetical protein
MPRRPRIAHLAGPNATIQNTPPLVTSNKARLRYGLAPSTLPDGRPAPWDVLRPQRLARPATVYVEQFSAHPLESDAAALYGPPDGFIDAGGQFHRERTSAKDTPVYEVELLPEDGLYPLPYMARQADGSAWEDDCTTPGGPVSGARQPFFPDGSRAFEEIDRLGIGEHGEGNLIAAQADIEFFRVLPPAGYTQGQAAADRTDTPLPGDTDGDIAPERRGEDFHYYRPYHLGMSPARGALATMTNRVNRVLASGLYDGAIWTQGSPRIEETLYWFNLLLDTPVPICGNSAQRTHGQLSNDGPKNLVDSVNYIGSRVWADEQGRNRVGFVLIQEQQIFAARDVQKGDARPGGYVSTGGHGGILGAVGHDGPAMLTYLPATRHTWQSEVNLTRLPRETSGVQRRDGRVIVVSVAIKNEAGDLLPEALPRVPIVKDGNYLADDMTDDTARELDLHVQIDDMLARAPLAGFVIEGLSPYGYMTARSRHLVMLRAVHMGLPVVRVGRGNNEGFTPPRDRFIGGRNLTATKARLLLMACLMRFGSLPPAADPDHPTPAELDAIRARLALYQSVFDTH